MNVAQARAILDESRARLLRREDTPQVGGGLIIRFWPEVAREDYEALRSFLGTYASAKNGSASSFVTGPKVDNEEQAGDWYCSKVSWDYGDADPGTPSRGGAKLQLFQWLVKGSSSEPQELVENGCQFLVYETTYFDLVTLPTLPANSVGTRYQMVKSFSEARGTWTVTVRKIVRRTQERTFTSGVEEFESESTQEQLGVTSGSLPALVQADGTIVTQDATQNDDCTVSGKTRTRTAVAVAQAGHETEVRAFEAVDEVVDRNQLVAATPITDQTPGTIKTARGDKNDFGRFDNRVRTRTARAVTDAEHVSSAGAFETLDASTDRNQSDVTAPVVSQTAGSIVEARGEKNEFGRFDNRRTTRAAVAVTEAARETEARTFETVDEVLDRNQTDTATAITSQTAGTIKTARGDKNEFGRFDNRVRTRTAVAVSDAEHVSSAGAFETLDASTDRNQSDVTAPVVSQTAGSIVEARGEKNEFGRFDNRRTTRTAVAVTEAARETEARTFETVDEVLDRNQTDTASPITIQTAGTIKTARGDKNEFGRFDNRVRTRTAVAVSDAEHVSSAGAFETLDASTDRNQTDVTAPVVTQTAGSIVEARGEKNEFGRFDNRRTTRAAVAVTAAARETEARAFETVDEVLDRNQVAEATPVTSQAAGTIKTARGDKNEFGRFDNRVRTRTAVASTGAERVKVITALETLLRNLDRNQASAASEPSSQTAGTIVEVRNILNEFMRYEVETTTRTARAVTDAEHVSSAGAFETLDASTDRNQADVTELVVEQTAGSIVEARGEKNEFGRFDNRRTTRAAVAVTAAARETEARAFEMVDEVLDRNQTDTATPITSQTAGTIQTARGDKNEFGRFDNRVRTRTAVASTGAERVKVITALETLLRNLDRNQASAASEPSSQTAGAIVEVRNILNEFMRYEVETTTRTAVPYDSGWVAYDDEDGTHYLRLFKNQASPLTGGMTTVTQNSLAFAYNEFGLVDGLAQRHPSTSGGGSSGDAFTTGTATFSYTNNEGKAVTVGIKFTTSLSAAQTFLSGSVTSGYTLRGHDGANRTGVDYLGRGRVAATRVWVQN